MMLARNKKALFNYELLEKYIAGISLMGYEVKALREGKGHMESSYITQRSGELFVVGLKIDRYSKYGGNFSEQLIERERKLLLSKHEIQQVVKEISEKGKTAVPLALILRSNYVKLEFGVVRGKKEFEKKQVEKEKQMKKETDQMFKRLRRSAY
jgi:SsrA-binding protein